jgi:site-specific DNA-methyltransferase (adenine-specific)
MKPYFQDESVTIYHADCRDILPLLPKVGLVLTDPPYGIAHPTDYASRGRGKLANCRDYAPVYGDDGPFDPAAWLGMDVPLILWGGNHYASRLPDSDGWLVWDKQRPEALDQSTCELAWTNCIHGVRIFHWLWNGMMRRGDEDLVHPTQKPVALFKWCLQWLSDARLILDPFMGSGTTLRAAKDLGRKAIGIEIEEKYCEIAAKRMSQSVMALA